MVSYVPIQFFRKSRNPWVPQLPPFLEPPPFQNHNMLVGECIAYWSLVVHTIHGADIFTCMIGCFFVNKCRVWKKQNLGIYYILFFLLAANCFLEFVWIGVCGGVAFFFFLFKQIHLLLQILY